MGNTKGINLRIVECKASVYSIINSSGLDTGICELILESVLNEVSKANIMSVRNESREFYSKKEGGEKDGKQTDLSKD